MKTVYVLILILCTTNHILAQHRELTGTVISPKNIPAPGVNIILKGTPNATVSNIHGRFKLNIPDGNNVIVYQLIGFKSLEQQILISKDSAYESTVTLIPDNRSNKKLKSSAVLSVKPVGQHQN